MNETRSQFVDESDMVEESLQSALEHGEEKMILGEWDSYTALQMRSVLS